MERRTWWKVWIGLAIGLAIGLRCLSAPPLLAQNPQRVLAQTSPGRSVSEKAQQAYDAGVQALLRGDSKNAKLDAGRAVKSDAGFADALALEATADLQQRQFASAKAEAARAVHLDASDEKAWVILATAENYLAQYSDAAAALRHVNAPGTGDWQFAYQWARAEAGMGDGSAVLEWTDRAALEAPVDFAPLHLLHASALAAAGQYERAADELESYLQLTEGNAPQRAALSEELVHLRRLARAITPTTRWNAASPNLVRNALAN